MNKGVFVTFEGGEGAGKSTQARLLAEYLAALELPVLITREPGGTPVSEKIRDILLDPLHPELAPRVELLLYLASRSQLVSQVIRPALEEGKVVISDRFHHSTLAYQGGARALDMAQVRQLNQFATGGLLPDVTFLLDLPPAAGMQRKGSAGQTDRLEGEGRQFHENVRQAFLTLAAEEPERIVVLDARRSVEEISEEIRRRTLDVLKIKGLTLK
ncbi:MAG: dTMP kinase [Candidatus Glassbacteria bacterium RIFCSPLOWO2_12_FULL_58_11]|uniref:Thymidylate kinase n=2 Tax=Candidatus Glassiibacteriota TaxID=1817805 RepID=A0A1F5YLX2_9BACT|nr:MAG: dTMP kinase [Candidatus Glassbacteria bacterium GWA2_58_10]OGG01145.1 MAG: dTMP kinase [Candidatus Glassbacteria bacterium RIFCSPLOWO2_12_FULL_58_11]